MVARVDSEPPQVDGDRGRQRGEQITVEAGVGDYTRSPAQYVLYSGERPWEGQVNLADAAEQVLRERPGQALHSKEITERALAAGLIAPRSETPWVYVAAAIRKENRRRQQRGDTPRFTAAGDGRYTLRGST